ncbi:MAG: hypothetical protein RLZZ214_2166 [Verrucomicrobiota bacterium]|jgi:hypothetical protein
MKRHLSITFALLGLASAGWLLVSKRTPVSHEESPKAPSSITSKEHIFTVDEVGNDPESTHEASGTIQGQDPRAETVKRPAVSNPPSSATRTSGALGLSSPPVKNSLSTRPPRSLPSVNPTRPTTDSSEQTRSKSSFASVHRNRARQGSNAPPSSFPVASEHVKPRNQEIVKPSAIPAEDIASADPAGVPASDHAPEDQVVIAPHVPQPAVWVDLGAASSLSQDKQDEIQGLAESLGRKITESGLDPASPEYKQLWDEAVVDSDQLFRQRYGNQAWMEHHIQAHHLAHAAGK